MAKTTHSDVVAYWSARQSECGLSVDWDEAAVRCWRCASVSTLQKCHIIPRSLGGGDGPENIVLLCHLCHRDAPNVDDADFMWRWLRAHAVPYDFWGRRAMKEFELMFGRPPRLPMAPPEHLGLIARRLFDRVIAHWGEGTINPSTVAWVIWKCETETLDSAGS